MPRRVEEDAAPATACGRLRVAVRVALRIPARLTLYSVLGQSSERYSYLVGRTDEQAFLDKARDSYGIALEFAAAGVPPELEPRGPPRGSGRGVIGCVGPGRCRHAPLWLPRLWPSAPGPARWCLVAADPTCPAAGSCRAAGQDRVAACRIRQQLVSAAQTQAAQFDSARSRHVWSPPPRVELLDCLTPGGSTGLRRMLSSVNSSRSPVQPSPQQGGPMP
jgi:hypothetical protein